MQSIHDNISRWSQLKLQISNLEKELEFHKNLVRNYLTKNDLKIIKNDEFTVTKTRSSMQKISKKEDYLLTIAYRN